ncbi:hypothetical protein MNB_SV-12-1387 [hydrothermal vent metagenome]|uniref:Lipoprotein n=1 Tax=hydrothermal vent metagenome TaxID=652676 RepID=A0A1W1BZJ1_9ZZZZ
MPKIIQLSLLSILLFTACEEKLKPVVTINPKLKRPISCMKLNQINMEKEVLDTFNNLYDFNETCDLILSVSYKKDIVCNSTQNVNMKNMGKFPKSYLKLSLRKGLEIEYTYYIDLYKNVDKEDMKEGFARLKEDLIKGEFNHPITKPHSQ